MFQGCEPSARSGKSYFPIIKVDKKKIHVDGGTKTLKVSLRSPCRPQTRIRVSDKMVEVLGLDLNTVSMANLGRTSDAIADAQFADAQAEAAIQDVRSGAVSELNVGTGVLSAVGGVDQFEQANEDYQRDTLINVEDGVYGVQGVADTVTLKGEAIPQVDVKGVYCVLTVAHTVLDPNTQSPRGRSRIARAKYLGDMTKGELFTFKVRFAMNEFNLRDAKYGFHLYTGDGEEIALSRSPGLRPLNKEEFAKMSAALNK